MGSPQSQAKAGRNGNVPPPEHRFKPGQSGNPGGMPKGKPITRHLNRLLEEVARTGKIPDVEKDATVGELLARAMLDHALKGKIDHAREILDRSEGKVKQEQTLEGDVTINVKYPDKR